MQFFEVEQNTLRDDSLCTGGHGGLAGGQRRAAVLHDVPSVTVVVELHLTPQESPVAFLMLLFTLSLSK